MKKRLKKLLRRCLTTAAALSAAVMVAAAGTSVNVLADTLPQTAAMSAAAAATAALPAAPDCSITYDFGTAGQYTVGSGTAMSMMRTNADGSWYIDPATGYYALDTDKVRAFFSGLQALYPAAVNVGGFVCADGAVLPYNANNCQTVGAIDTDKEIGYLGAAIMMGLKEVHKPYTTMGGTYIEIDIPDQMLYYYTNGAQQIATPIVTGCIATQHETPAGVYLVRNKQTNQNLVGKDYISFVNYWMPIVGNSIGIHDATWRRNFGGTIYQTSGSHGCINVPLSVMQQLYPIVNIGTTVVVHE